MEKKKIYLETTLFNYYYDTENPDFRNDTIELFKACAEGRFEPYTSSYVTDELEAAPREKYVKMINLTKQYNITIYASSDEADDLAEWYIFKGALPKRSLTDASHIAAASVNKLDTIASLNFRHIVRRKTNELINEINTSFGYSTIEINSPKEALDYEKYRRSRLG